MGVRFFDRARDGYTATAAAEEVSALVRRLRADVLAVERRIVGRDLRPSGTLRVTTTDTLLFGWLSPGLREFRRAYPDIRLELVVSNDVFSLSKREADIAVRPAHKPDESLVGRRIGTIAQAPYMAKALATQADNTEALASIEWIGPDESMTYPAYDRWLEQDGLVERCRIRVNSVYGMLSAARAGLGVSVLPCYLGENDEQLSRVGWSHSVDGHRSLDSHTSRSTQNRAHPHFSGPRCRACKDVAIRSGGITRRRITRRQNGFRWSFSMRPRSAE